MHMLICFLIPAAIVTYFLIRALRTPDAARMSALTHEAQDKLMGCKFPYELLHAKKNYEREMERYSSHKLFGYYSTMFEHTYNSAKTIAQLNATTATIEFEDEGTAARLHRITTV